MNTMLAEPTRNGAAVSSCVSLQYAIVATGDDFQLVEEKSIIGVAEELVAHGADVDARGPETGWSVLVRLDRMTVRAPMQPGAESALHQFHLEARNAARENR